MEKKTLKLYGFKLKGEDMVNLFNESDLFGYEKDESGKWTSNGFGWLVNNPTYIIDSFYDFFGSDAWEYLTSEEFAEIVNSDDDLRDFNCVLLDRNYLIERLFNKSSTYADINTIEDLEEYPNNATYTHIASVGDYDEPIYYSKSEMIAEIEDNNNIGKYRIIY